ncbi:MAG: hypothetical protein RLY86_1873 [Pseudomonadota bacterium]|jgi:hypothetical protein
MKRTLYRVLCAIIVIVLMLLGIVINMYANLLVLIISYSAMLSSLIIPINPYFSNTIREITLSAVVASLININYIFIAFRSAHTVTIYYSFALTIFSFLLVLSIIKIRKLL